MFTSRNGPSSGLYAWKSSSNGRLQRLSLAHRGYVAHWVLSENTPFYGIVASTTLFNPFFRSTMSPKDTLSVYTSSFYMLSVQGLTPDWDFCHRPPLSNIATASPRGRSHSIFAYVHGLHIGFLCRTEMRGHHMSGTGSACARKIEKT